MPSIIEQLATRNPFGRPLSFPAQGTVAPGGAVTPDMEVPRGPPPTKEQNLGRSTLRGIVEKLNQFGDNLILPQNGLGRAGAYIGAASGSPLGLASMAAMRAQREDEQADAENAFREAQVIEMQRKAQMPRIEHIGGMIGTVDQNTGSFTPTFTAPRPEESYAAALGYTPGTAEWNTALQDYVLKTSGPTAYDFDEQLEGVRQNNREQLEGLRQTNRSALKGQPTYSQTHPRPKLSPRAVPGGVPKGGIKRVKTLAEARSLPPGTWFETPDGRRLQRGSGQ